MKRISLLSLFVLLASGASILAACGGAAPVTPTATIIPTSAPTAIPPTATLIPPTVKPTATSEPTNTPAPRIDSNADKAVREAFGKFQAAKAFRLEALAELSPLFFQGNYTPLPGEDPNKVTLFVIKGEQSGTDLHYALNGFIATFIGLFSGFDPNSNALEIAKVGDALYMRGTLPKETQARWFSIPADRAASMSFTPQDLIAPMLQAVYPDSAFAKTGEETLGNQNCTVYDATRAAFDAVLPRLAQVVLVNEDSFAAGNIERAEYKVWVCADGNLYRIRYNFDAHDKTDASKKGSMTFEADITDHDATIAVQAPTDALPLPPETSGTGTAPATPLTETPVVTPAAFASLEGDWEGTSGTDSLIQFTVENSQVTFANLGYLINTASCSFGGTYGASVEDGTITDQSFSVVLTNSDEVKFTFAGNFSSNNDAAGTLQIKGKTFCGDTDVQSSWTAKHVSSPESPTVEATAEPTEALTAAPTETPSPTPTRAPTVTATPQGESGTAIVMKVFDALARQDVEGVLAFFDDNIVYTIGTTGGVGKDSLRSNLELAMSVGTTFKVSNVQEVGDIVRFTVEATGFGGGTFSNSSVIIRDGKIAILTIQ